MTQNNGYITNTSFRDQLFASDTVGYVAFEVQQIDWIGGQDGENMC